MGLPFWPDGAETGGGDGWADAPAVAEPERASEALSTLANPVRLSVLATLHEAGSLSYTDLRTAVGVEDRGRFNYHLRQLEGLVESDGGAYVLTERGERVVERVLTSDALPSGT